MCLSNVGFAFVAAVLFNFSEEFTKYACENSSLKISCSQGTFIKVTHANYGRTSAFICPGNISASTCVSVNAINVVIANCNNMASCVLRASSEVFDDPCPDSEKYLEVEYDCETPTTTVSTAATTQEVLTSPAPTPCECNCPRCWSTIYMTIQEIHLYPEIVEEIKQNLTKELAVNKTELSSTRRKLSSAPDNRVSATLVGYIGVIIMVGVMSIFLISDLLSIFMPQSFRNKKMEQEKKTKRTTKTTN